MTAEASGPDRPPTDPPTRMFSWAAAAAKLLLWFLVVLLFACNFPSLSDGLGGLARRLPEIVKLSVGAVSVEMDPSRIEEEVKDSSLPQADRDNWGAQQSKNAGDGLRALDKRSVVRLMNVGLLKDLCRFANPTSDMLFDYAVDQRLAEKGLAKISPNAETLQKVRNFVHEQEKTGKPFPLGQPSECYDLTLTGKGYDVRTWLAHVLAANFNPSPSRAAAPSRP